MNRWGQNNAGSRMAELGSGKWKQFHFTVRWLAFAAFLLLPAAQAAAQSVAKLLSDYNPKQRFVDYQIPTADQLPKCKVEKDANSIIVLGPEGQVLRRFMDTNGDKNRKVDQWRYYQHGLEVYREIDTNDNDKADQYRWLNLGGSRWGIDDNEDGRIDRWKSLSAAEASREAIVCMTTGDFAGLQLLMVTPQELAALGVTPAIGQKILEATATADSKAQAVLKKSKLLNSRTKWVRFEGQMPGTIPADEGKASQDLQVYEAAMAIVEQSTAGSKEPVTGLVQLGELVRVGEVWKLTQVPQPIEGNEPITSSGVLMQPPLDAGGGPNIPAPSPALQKVIEELQALDAKPPQLGVDPPAKLAEYNAKRADLLIKLYNLSDGPDEKSQFLKQCVDGLAAAVQTDAYPAGLARIEKIEADLAKSPKSPLLPYVIYRSITSRYAVDMKSAKPDEQQKVQTAWLGSLSNFVKDYPDAEDVADAMWQLATAEEFGGNQTAAVNWYQRLSKDKRGSVPADKAEGALRRLNLKGAPFPLNGAGLEGGTITTNAYRGKTLLVVYWATWSNLFMTDLPQLRALHQQYKNKGFEVLGVCLDIPGGTRPQQVAEIQKYLTQNNIPWPQIFEQGGLDSPPAVQYGIIALPTMILIDQRGEVVSRQSSVTELRQLLPTLLK